MISADSKTASDPGTQTSKRRSGEFALPGKAEQELLRLNRSLRALRKSSRAMTRSDSESSFLAEACRIIVEDCGHAMAWIGYAEENEGKTVRPVAQAGFEQSYLDTLRITWADDSRGAGPTGTAIRTGQPVTCRNILTDPRFAPWREEAQKRGYASSFALPLMAEGKAFGAISIYSKEPDPLSDDDVTLLAELADDVAYGVASLRLRAAHAKAEDTLRQSEERYRALFDNMLDGVAYHEMLFENGRPRDFRFLSVNRAFEGVTGLKNVVGKKATELIAGHSGVPSGADRSLRPGGDDRPAGEVRDRLPSPSRPRSPSRSTAARPDTSPLHWKTSPSSGRRRRACGSI